MYTRNDLTPLQAWRAVFEALTLLLHLLWWPRATKQRDEMVSAAEGRLIEAIMDLGGCRWGGHGPLRIEVSQRNKGCQRRGWMMEQCSTGPIEWSEEEEATPKGLMGALEVADAVGRGSMGCRLPDSGRTAATWRCVESGGGVVRLAWIGVPDDGGPPVELDTPGEVEDWARRTDPDHQRLESLVVEGALPALVVH